MTLSYEEIHTMVKGNFSSYVNEADFSLAEAIVPIKNEFKDYFGYSKEYYFCLVALFNENISDDNLKWHQKHKSTIMLRLFDELIEISKVFKEQGEQLLVDEQTLDETKGRIFSSENPSRSQKPLIKNLTELEFKEVIKEAEVIKVLSSEEIEQLTKSLIQSVRVHGKKNKKNDGTSDKVI